MIIQLTIPDKDTADELERVISRSSILLWQTGPDSYTVKRISSPLLDKPTAQGRCDAVNARTRRPL